MVHCNVCGRVLVRGVPCVCVQARNPPVTPPLWPFGPPPYLPRNPPTMDDPWVLVWKDDGKTRYTCCVLLSEAEKNGWERVKI